MGKYIRKARRMRGVAVSQGLSGMRTRARALALELKHSKNLAASFQPAWGEPKRISSVEVRGKRLSKIISCSCAKEQAGHCKGARKCRLKFSGMPDDCSSMLARSEEDRNAMTDEDTSSLSQLEDKPLHSSVGGSLNSDNLSRSDKGRARGAVHSRSNSISHELSQGVLTRNQKKQEKRASASTEDMNLDAGPSCQRRDGRNSDNSGVRIIEVEVSSGESPIDEACSLRDSKQASKTRIFRESTPRSCYGREVEETPGSATKGDARSLMEAEIEAFFEQMGENEQRRCIERYNFDPVNDVPLPGRYEWLSLQPKF